VRFIDGWVGSASLSRLVAHDVSAFRSLASLMPFPLVRRVPARVDSITDSCQLDLFGRFGGGRQ